MSTEQPKYSRAEISDETKRQKTASEIKAMNNWVDKKKTPEGKKELSQTWVQKANLTPAQKQALCDELLVKDIDSEDPKELERRVMALQKHLGFPAKDCDGILWWKTLEETDKMIEEQHKTGDEETGGKDESETYGLDRVAREEQRKKEQAEKPAQLRKQLAEWQTEGLTDINGSSLQIEDGENGEKLLKWTGENSDKYYDIDSWTYETKDERASRISKVNSETQNKREQELAALKKNMNSDDRGVTENLVYWEDRLSVQIGENGDKYLQRDSDGKVLNFETGEYEAIEDRTNRLAKSKDATTEEYKAKMREIDEEMKSNPDVYSDTETGKSTYTFNGEELSLEWKAPNQYITRTVNGNKQMWESESESWEDIKETKYNTQRIADISNIDGTPLPENSWTEIGKSVYFRNWENLIAIAPGGKLRENINGKWQDIKDFSQLPKNIREAAADSRLQYFQKNYWDWKEGEFWSGTTANFQDIPLSQYNRFDESGNEQSRLEGRILREMVEWLLESNKTSAPRMWELTLWEYNKYKQNPDLFAQSRFTESSRKRSKEGFCRPCTIRYR